MNEEYSKLDQALDSPRSEEVAHIIDRMPSKFGLAVTGIVIFIFVMLLFFGYISRYPDISTGQMVINSTNSPIKLVANANGKLKLDGVSTLATVKEGQTIAYLENTTTPQQVDSIKAILLRNNPAVGDIVKIGGNFPKKISIGELNLKYYTFINALQQYINHKQDKAFKKQRNNYTAISDDQKKSIQTSTYQYEMAKKSLLYASKFYKRDSILFIKRVISESELDQTEMSYLNAKDKVQSALNAILMAKQNKKSTDDKIEQLGIQDPEKEKDVYLNVISTYNDILDNVKLWEQKYVFKGPFDGKVQFLKFYAENQFIQSGEAVFTLVPINKVAYGQVILPAIGAGKVKIGQEVIVKLDNFPYMEYGSVEGRIKTISLTTNTEKTDKGNLETYLITVAFPKGLKTNYGKMLDFRYESKGTAEIITNDRRLIERLFDNLKYSINK